MYEILPFFSRIVPVETATMHNRQMFETKHSAEKFLGHDQFFPCSFTGVTFHKRNTSSL